MAGKVTPPSGRQKRPRYWDKMVSAAYLRMMGATQAECAKSVGRSRRTIQLWESDTETWAQARAEASERWLAEATDAARRAVLAEVRAGNAEFGFRILERVDRRLAPPKQKHEHTGRGGGPIETTSTVQVYIPANGRESE